MPLIVSISPHVKTEENVASIMKLVCIALLPAIIWSVRIFGVGALLLLALSVASCVATEAVCQKLRGRPVTVNDWSAVVTGLLLAGVLPVNLAWWMPVAGGIFAIGVGKHAFGGLGNNIWNPALLGRAFLGACFAAVVFQASWPALRQPEQGLPKFGTRLAGMTEAEAKLNPDVVTGATALRAIKYPMAKARVNGLVEIQGEENYYRAVWQTFLGAEGGCVLEVSALALLIGGLFLLATGVITWEVPLPYLATATLLGWALPAKYFVGGELCWTGWFQGPALLHLCGGGLFLGAFFMATDMVTNPITFNGRLIFAVGCGVLTAVIRLYAGYPEGVCYSILIMNTCVPLIDAWTRPVKFGARRPEAAAA